jgi:hypothetical protein
MVGLRAEILARYRADNWTPPIATSQLSTPLFSVSPFWLFFF